VLPAGCAGKGVDIDAVELVPNDAQIAFGFDMEPIERSPVSGPLGEGIRRDPNFAPIIDTLPKCEVDTNKLEGVVAMQLDSDNVFIAFDAPGIGNEQLLECLEKEHAKADGTTEPKAAVFEAHGKVRRARQDGGGWAVILNDHTVAFVEGSWEGEIFARIDDPGARTHDGPLGAALRRVDTDAHVWGAMQLDDEMRSAMSAAPGSAQLQNASVTVDLSDGIAVSAELEFSEAGQAEAFATSLQAQMTSMKQMYLAASFPPSAVESIEIDAEATIVSGSLKVDASDVMLVSQLIGAMFR